MADQLKGVLHLENIIKPEPKSEGPGLIKALLGIAARTGGQWVGNIGGGLLGGLASGAAALETGGLAAPAIPAAVTGGMAAGGALGGGAGELIAQQIEQGLHIPTKTDWARAGVGASLGAVPGTAIVRAGKPALSIALGAGQGIASNAGYRWAEGASPAKAVAGALDYTQPSNWVAPVLGGAAGGVFSKIHANLPPKWNPTARSVTPEPGVPVPPTTPDYKSAAGLRVVFDKLKNSPKGPANADTVAAHAALAEHFAPDPKAAVPVSKPGAASVAEAARIKREIGIPDEPTSIVDYEKAAADAEKLRTKTKLETEKAHEAANKLVGGEVRESTKSQVGYTQEVNKAEAEAAKITEANAASQAKALDKQVAEAEATRQSLAKAESEAERVKLKDAESEAKSMDRQVAESEANAKAAAAEKIKADEQHARNLKAREDYIKKSQEQDAKNLNANEKAAADEAAKARIDKAIADQNLSPADPTVSESVTTTNPDGSKTRLNQRYVPPEPEKPTGDLDIRTNEDGLDLNPTPEPTKPKGPPKGGSGGAPPPKPVGPPARTPNKVADFNKAVQDTLDKAEIPKVSPKNAKLTAEHGENLAEITKLREDLRGVERGPQFDMMVKRLRALTSRNATIEGNLKPRAAKAAPRTPAQIVDHIMQAHKESGFTGDLNDLREKLTERLSRTIDEAENALGDSGLNPKRLRARLAQMGGINSAGDSDLAILMDGPKRGNPLRSLVRNSKSGVSFDDAVTQLSREKEFAPHIKSHGDLMEALRQMRAGTLKDPASVEDAIDDFVSRNLPKVSDPEPIAQDPGKLLEALTERRVSPAGSKLPAGVSERRMDELVKKLGGTQEVQPTLPGAEGVRAQEIATPEVAEAPFSLSPPKLPKAWSKLVNAEQNPSLPLSREPSPQTRTLFNNDAADLAKSTPPKPGGGSTLFAGADPNALIELAKKYPQFATKLLGTAVGGGVGAAFDKEDRGRGALLGGLAGLGATSLKPGALDEVTKRIPNYLRASMLSHYLPLAYNSLAGPWGSQFFGGLERTAMGHTDEGLSMVGNAANVPKWLGRFWSKAPEALEKIHDIEGRADMGNVGTLPVDKLMERPAQAMLMGDLTSKSFADEAGVPEEVARRLGNTAEPRTPLGKWLVNFGKTPDEYGNRWGALSTMMLPFKRTAANILENGLERNPITGPALNLWRQTKAPEHAVSMLQSAAQAGLGSGVWYASYLLGESVPEASSKTWKLNSLVSNIAGPYALLAGSGFAAGQARRKGNSAKSAAFTSLDRATPLPTTDIAHSLYDAVTKQDLSGLKSFLPGALTDVTDWAQKHK